MTGAAILLIALAIWVISSSWRFYHYVRWSDKPAATPDVAALRKREKELLRLHEVLKEARAEGKVSVALMDEYERFCDSETAEIRAVTGDSPSRP